MHSELELLTWASGLTFSHLTWELSRGVGRKGRSGSGISKSSELDFFFFLIEVNKKALSCNIWRYRVCAPQIPNLTHPLHIRLFRY